MSVVLHVAEHIHMSKGTSGKEDISQIFPFLFWVLRDFSLDLKGMTPEDYMEKALKPVAGGSSQETEKKNEIRNKIASYFKKRTCHCLPRPLGDEKRLAHIEEEPWENLRPVFREGVLDFLKSLRANLAPKAVNGKPLTGKMYLSLILEYVNTMNSGRVPAILNTFERIYENEMKAIQKKMTEKFEQGVKKYIEVDKFPVNPLILEQKFFGMLKSIQNEAEEVAKKKENPEIAIKLYKENFETFERLFKEHVSLNDHASTKQVKTVLHQFMNAFVLPSLSKLEDASVTMINEITEKYKIFHNFFMANAAGPQKCKEVFQGALCEFL